MHTRRAGHVVTRPLNCGVSPHVKLFTRVRRPIAVALGFLAFIAVSLLVAYLVGLRPTQAEACQRQCASAGKAGVLVYKGPPSSKRNPLYDPFSECECR